MQQRGWQRRTGKPGDCERTGPSLLAWGEVPWLQDVWRNRETRSAMQTRQTRPSGEGQQALPPLSVP